jgi:PHD/YefM family antitoxin component YafN of YafNO toxin-antitoxin module
MTAKTYSTYSLNTINLIDFRKDLGKVIDNNNAPLQIVKRGKPIGIVLPVDLGLEFLEWQKMNNIRQKYLSQKQSLIQKSKNIISKSFPKSNLNTDELTPDQIIELVSKI